MRRTRLSLFYLAGYLVPAGLALIVAPKFAMDLLGSNGEYGDVLPRLLGVILLALGSLIVQIIRHQLDVLYPTTVVIRVAILAVLMGLYLYADDPFFLTLFVIVGVGVLFTGISYLRDRAEAEPRSRHRPTPLLDPERDRQA